MGPRAAGRDGAAKSRGLGRLGQGPKRGKGLGDVRPGPGDQGSEQGLGIDGR